ncbi:MAG: O-acetylhomoserine aminocarboxypropyltransferase/cysteine synthase [Tissierellia bacterium]|nr:O-acetylhomoserine aminocarboxypropyltransferase/cysteine synthase [Tissierellia bacterium]
MKNLSVETLCVQGGYEPENGETRIVPIYQSTTYKYDSADEVGDLFDLVKEGHMYSRISNPTLDVFEKKLALLEGGIGAVSTSSGQAANLLAILTLCKNGDHIIAFNNLYGGTFVLIQSRLKDFGIETTFVSLDDTDEEIESHIKENTKLIFGETLSNPSVRVFDIERYADLAHRHGIPLIVDNTFPTPYLCRPFDFGADIVTHSTTKYLDGHATSVGGIIVDSGKFDWNNGNFPCLTDEDPNYHGLSYTKAFGEAAYITKARVVFIRDLGTTLSPFNAFLTNLGAETLALRMDRHSENALTIAKHLQASPNVAWVKYPLLEDNEDYELAKKYLSKGASGIISFGVKGGVEEGKKFIDSLELASLVVHVGDIRTHVLHPASMTHRQLSKEAQEAAGIEENAIRLSVGIENADEIIADLDQALEKSQR